MGGKAREELSSAFGGVGGALRLLIKSMRLDGKGKCGCARHSCVGVDLWRASQGGMGM